MATLLLSIILAAASAPDAAGAPVAADAALLADENLVGKVVSAGDGKLVIVDDDGDNEEFEVTAKTKITRNQKEADLDDLQEGDLVKVKAQRKGVKFVALVIEARAPE